MDGLLIVDKPEGLTSFDVVARVRRAAGERRVGHAGTLDPLATGVLPLALGRATRVLEFLSEAGKEYRAGVTLGATTETYDREGPVTSAYAGAMPARGEVEAALGGFRGRITQLPPMHSAVKHQGKRLYELARAGIEVERRPREVTIYRLELTSYEPPFLELVVECSKGTYVRSLAHDLGQLLGCGAHLASLIRTRHGPFGLDQAHRLAELEQAGGGGTLRQSLLPLDAAVSHLPRIDLDEREAGMLLNGREISARAGAEESAPARAYGPGGDFLALVVAAPERQTWKPLKVLKDNASNN